MTRNNWLNPNRKKLLIAIVYSILIFGAGFGTEVFLIKRAASNNTNVSRALREGDSAEYKFIKPLLLCDYSERKGVRELTDFESKIDSLVQEEKNKNNITTASVYLRELYTGRWLSVNENERYSPASLLKVPKMIAYFKLAESDPTILSKKVYFEKPQEDQNKLVHYKPNNPIKSDELYTIEELIEAMITQSDNNAHELLEHNIDPKILNEVYTDLGLNTPNPQYIGDFITVKAYSQFFRILFNSTYLTRALSEKALNLLSQSNFNAGIKNGLPKNITAAEKFGERTFIDENGNVQFRELHDCGIVYYPNKPYVICIMIKGQDFDKMASSIAGISKFAYKEIDNEIK